jgi:carboxymethylenebutenolidase
MARKLILGAATLATLMTCTAGLAGPAAAQDWAKANLAKSPRHGEYVTIHEGSGRDLQAWVVYPEVKGKAPVVVMIHEIFGLSDWAREMADEVAAAGYIVVEPDLLSGLGPAGPAATTSMLEQQPHLLHVSMQQDAAHMHGSLPAQTGAGAAYAPATPGGTSAFPDQGAIVKAVSSLPDPQVLTDLDAAADYGKHLPAASGKLFVTGFCWGGGKTFLFATHRHDLSAAFVFYGPPPATDLMKNITAPVYGFYAANDARITSTVDSTRTAMKAAGKTFEPVVYDGAGHGFMRAGEAPDASPENSAARQAGFRRLVQLLGGVR